MVRAPELGCLAVEERKLAVLLRRERVQELLQLDAALDAAHQPVMHAAADVKLFRLHRPSSDLLPARHQINGRYLRVSHPGVATICFASMTLCSLRPS